MSKERKRGNREVKKPKQEKAPPKPDNVFGSLARSVANGDAQRGKGKPR